MLPVAVRSAAVDDDHLSLRIDFHDAREQRYGARRHHFQPAPCSAVATGADLANDIGRAIEQAAVIVADVERNHHLHGDVLPTLVGGQRMHGRRGERPVHGGAVRPALLHESRCQFRRGPVP